MIDWWSGNLIRWSIASQLTYLITVALSKEEPA
jgi:hypothetical protein